MALPVFFGRLFRGIDKHEEGERWDIVHQKKEGLTFDFWSSRIGARTSIDHWGLLRLELTNCWCPVGCRCVGLALLIYGQ